MPVCVDVGAYVCHTELDTLWVVHICWSFSFFVYTKSMLGYKSNKIKRLTILSKIKDQIFFYCKMNWISFK